MTLVLPGENGSFAPAKSIDAILKSSSFRRAPSQGA